MQFVRRRNDCKLASLLPFLALQATLVLGGCARSGPEGVWETAGPSAGPLQFVRLELRSENRFSCEAVFTEGNVRERVRGTWTRPPAQHGILLELIAEAPASPRLFAGRTSLLVEARLRGQELVLPRGFVGEGVLVLRKVGED